MRTTAWMLAGAMLFAVTATVPDHAHAANAEDSEAAGPHQAQWARWQGRLSLGTASVPGHPGTDRPVTKSGSVSLTGDYYFDPSSSSSTVLLGGFRATTGLSFGRRSTLNLRPAYLPSGGAFSVGSHALGQAGPSTNDGLGESATATYLGVGYTGLAQRSGWSFSADLGLVAQSATVAARWARNLNTSQSLDDAIRQLRMSPLLQLGVAYTY